MNNPTIITPDFVNYNNAHIRDPGFSSNQGAVTGYIGSLNSQDALKGTGVYHVQQQGGDGYGMSKNQMLSQNSGVQHGNRADFASYKNTGINSDTSIHSSMQRGGNSTFGAGGVPYYSYQNQGGANLSVFAGSGYPPISRELNTQCYSPGMNGGAKKRKSRKNKTAKKAKKAKKSKKSKTAKKAKKSKKRKTAKKSKKSQKGGNFPNISNVPYAHGYSTGAPPTLAGGQSSLANPIPYQSYNNCVDNYKHTGSE